MNALVLGGTHFVGRHIVEELHRSGHSVSILNRGRSRDELPAQVERLRGDRDRGDAGLDSLDGRSWDVCVDVSGYTAQQVRSTAEKLRRNVGFYVFVSAVSVYGDPTSGPVDETHPRSKPASEDIIEITGDTYGPLKVTCENIIEEVFKDSCALLRSQIVAGPYDPLDRFSYWVRRASQRGTMVFPGDGTDYLQYVDARDVARFTLAVCEKGLSGSFNLAGPRLTWRDFATILDRESDLWIPKEMIANARVTEFELPLYRPVGGPRSSLMHVSNARAVAAGLQITKPAVTVMDVRNWLQGTEVQAPALSPEREDQLIKMARST